MIRFAFYIHNHQPPGNFDEVFESAYKYAYQPLLDTILRHKKIKFGIHYSGPLLEWLNRNHPEHLELLKDSLTRGQAELLGSAYAEPILSMIPEQDAIDQIKFFNDYLYQKFKIKPRGLWLTERVWEPQLIRVLCAAGIEYTLIDDTVFLREGLTSNRLNSYYITEKEGDILKIFPISMDLRYLIPFQKFNRVKKFLNRSKSRILWIMADDGEKFGFWPGTYKRVYQQGWLDRFLNFLEKNPEIETVLLSDIANQKPAGKIYLPSSSYTEMEEWTLPPERTRIYRRLKKCLGKKYFTFLRGGYFYNFLRKYPEANLMHKRMLYVSQNIKNKKRHIQDLWRGQSACAYWHGLFGGLYLPHLRAEVYKNLLKAEGVQTKAHYEKKDFDGDSQKELIYSDKNFFFVIKPDTASFIEIDHRKEKRNLLNYLGRHPEVYHKKRLVYDRYPRGFGIDHILHRIPSLNEFFRGRNLGKDIRYDRFKVMRLKPLRLKFCGEIEKQIELNPKNNRIIELKYRGNKNIFGIELSLGLFSPRFCINKKWHQRKKLKIEELQEFSIDDRGFAISIQADRPFSLLSYQIETVSRFESGQERITQGIGLMLIFKSLPQLRVIL